MTGGGDDDDTLDRLAEEFLDRLRRGERPAVREFAARLPERSGEVRELLSALVLVEELKPQEDETPDHGGRTPPGWRGGAVPDRLGDFRILREVGRGGMGVVYEAEQESLGRRVAVKVLTPQFVQSPQLALRFLREARSAAQLHHTNIVPVFGVGEHDGQHYYAMQFIRGLALDSVLGEVKRLKGLAGADARDDDAPTRSGPSEIPTSMAPRTRISGRDTPPHPPPPPPPPRPRPTTMRRPSPCPASRRWRRRRPGRTSGTPGASPGSACRPPRRSSTRIEQGTLHRDIKPSNLLLDAHGTVWVTDFGLAKAAEDEDLTRTGDLVGTLRYMAPERFQGRCDARSDVYALGLTLYEMLALRPAFDARDRHPLIYQVTHTRPPRLRLLDPGIPRDLETIVHKAIEKDPADRYPSAGLLAEDLRRWLEHEPIRARPSGPLERLVKWSRREPTLAALIAVSILGVAAVLATLTVSHAQVTRSLHRERRLSYFQSIALAEQAWSGNDVGRAEELLDGSPSEFRGWEWRYLKRLCHADLLTLRVHAGLAAHAVAFSPDGATLATAGPSGTISLRESRTGRTIRTLGGHGGGVYDVAFSPDGSRLASAGGDGTVRVWDVASGRELLALSPRYAGAVLDVAFSPDGTRLASASGDFWEGGRGGSEGGGVTIWESATGREVHTLNGHVGTVYRVAFSPDGTRLASAGGDGTVRVWDVASGGELRRLGGHDDAVRGLAFSPDGSRLASAGQDGVIRVGGVDGGAPDLELRDPDDRFFAVAFSPDGSRLASAGRNWTVTLWDAATGGKLSTFRGHTREVVGLAFSPDGSRLASAGYEGVVKVWDTNRDQGALVLRGRAGEGTAVAFSPDGRRVAMASDEPGGGLHLWDAATGRPAPAPEGADEPFASVAFGPDGTSLAAGRARTGDVTLWDPATGRAVRTWKAHAGAVTAVAFSPDGRRLATGGKDRIVAVWDPASGRRLFSAGPLERAVTGLAFSPDGRHLAVSTGDRPAIEAPGEVAILDAETGRRVRTLTGHEGGVSDLAYSPDGRHLATSSWDRTVAVWDPSTGRQVHSFAIRGLIAWAVAFSPDGRRLVAADNIGRMKFWDVESGLDVLTLRGHMDRIYDLAFSPDGNRLASSSRDATARVWDATPLGPVPAAR